MAALLQRRSLRKSLKYALVCFVWWWWCSSLQAFPQPLPEKGSILPHQDVRAERDADQLRRDGEL